MLGNISNPAHGLHTHVVTIGIVHRSIVIRIELHGNTTLNAVIADPPTILSYGIDTLLLNDEGDSIGTGIRRDLLKVTIIIAVCHAKANKHRKRLCKINLVLCPDCAASELL